MKTPLLEIDNISKRFEENSILKNVSFSVNKGEFVSFIGPSGCGKTTLFNIISGVLQQDSGDILIEGSVVKNRKGKFGYMFQDPLLLPWKTVLENIKIAGTIKGLLKEQAKEQAMQLLKEFKLEESAYMYPASLSGGMAQRIALLRTVLFNNQLLLLDEPLGALDSLTRSTLQVWLLEVCRRVGATVLFITHDIAEAILLSDTIYVLSNQSARIVKRISINLEKPRSRSQLALPKSISLEKEIEKLLLTNK